MNTTVIFCLGAIFAVLVLSIGIVIGRVLFCEDERDKEKRNEDI